MLKRKAKTSTETAKKTAKPSKPYPKTPTIDVYSIRDYTDLDYFPHLKADVTTDHGQVIQSLKDGTYTPFMGAVEYDVEFKNGVFSASVKNQDIIASPQDREFTANVNTPDGKRLNDIERMYKDKIPTRRKYYANPRQYYDHVLLADGYTNSFAGTVIDTWADFNIPRRIKPVLKLRYPDKDRKKDEKEITKNQDIIDKIINVEQWYSDMGPKEIDTYFDIPIQQKIKAAFKLREVFGRCAIIKENWRQLDPVTVGNEEYKNLPNVLKIMHPIEMGITEVELYTGKVAGMWVSNDQPYIPSSDMIYMVNEYSSPMIGSATYGFSRMQRSIDQVRLYRRLLAVNFPQYMRTSASGMGAFIVNTTGYSQEIRNKIRLQLKNSFKTAELAVIDYANVQDFEFKEFKINTDISALVELEEAMLKSIANIIGVPQSIILDSGSPARATLVGRLITFINNNVAQSRMTFAQQLSSQWYMPIFRALYKNDKDILDKFYIDVEFEEVSLETKQEKVERLLAETQLNPYTDEYLGEVLEDEGYLNHIDEEKIKEQKEMEKQQMQMQKMSMQNKAGQNKPGQNNKNKDGNTFNTKSNSVGERSTMRQN